jgi:hypothetical protein
VLRSPRRTTCWYYLGAAGAGCQGIKQKDFRALVVVNTTRTPEWLLER